MAFIRFAVAPSPDPSNGEVWFAARRRESSDPGSVYVINVFGDWIKYGWWDVIENPVRGVWLTEQSTVAAFMRRIIIVANMETDERTRKKELVASHGYIEGTMDTVVVPNVHPAALGASVDAETGEWIINEGKS